jgi:glycosyltransferase involved in cell wall biosynthesis
VQQPSQPPSSDQRALPAMTVALPTRDRPDDVARCLASLSQVRYPAWSLLVIDQSTTDATRQIVDQYTARLPAVRYRHMDQTGLSRSRNLALREAEGEILAFIDDDCTVGPTWLEDVAAAFSRHPDVPLIFGQVRAIPHDPKQSYVLSYEVSAPRILRGRLASLRVDGMMGASMYLRRAACRRVGPFDVHAGVGAEFVVEDRDYVYRHLRAGNPVLLTPEISVLHYGLRFYKDGGTQAMLRGFVAWGAQDMKYLRCGDPAIALIIPGHLIELLGYIDWHRIVRGRLRESKVSWIVKYCSGLLAGARVPIIRAHGLWGRTEDYAREDLPPASASDGGAVASSSSATQPRPGRWLRLRRANH